MREAGERQVGMNRPDKAGEPSMEEILASIRQIIADDPATDRTAPVIEANPFVPQSPSAERSESPKPRLVLGRKVACHFAEELVNAPASR